MNKYLLKAKDTYRVETVEDVEALHEQLLADPDFTVIQFGYKTKYIKEKGEIIDEYQIVDVTKQFVSDEKDPEERYDVWYGFAGKYDTKTDTPMNAEDF